MVARSPVRSTAGYIRALCCSRRNEGLTGAGEFAGAEEETSWDLVDGEDTFSSLAAARLWRRAVEWLVRLAKFKTRWWAHGQALRFISERRKSLNSAIEAELRSARRRRHGDQ